MNPLPQQAWIERTWSFEFPVSLFPSLIERLRGTPARLEESLAGIARKHLVQADQGAWSLQRHAGHLLDLETLFQGRYEEFMAGEEQLRAADMSNAATEAADHDGPELGELLTEFRRVRHSYIAKLDALQPSDFERRALHPRLQTPMRLVDMCMFHADHDDHHLAIIQALKIALA